MEHLDIITKLLRYDFWPFFSMTDEIVGAFRSAKSTDEVKCLIEIVAREMGCRYFALIHHTDLRIHRPGLIDIKDYPPAITHRLIEQGQYRRDPVVRACMFADSAFLWSELHSIVQLNQHDRATLAYGLAEGLNEGITVPYTQLGACLGSCTFAGMRQPDSAARYIGPAQMIGVFAFQAARRVLTSAGKSPASPPRLHPRPRDCVVLAGCGFSNKQIARTLAITPRTVDGYLTEARRIFGAHDRTELVVSAVLAGEVGLHEFRDRQPG